MSKLDAIRTIVEIVSTAQDVYYAHLNKKKREQEEKEAKQREKDQKKNEGR